MKYVKILALTATTLCLLVACSSDDDEKGKIETMTEKAGQEAVRMIKTPIDKAQAVADQEEQRARELDKQHQE